MDELIESRTKKIKLLKYGLLFSAVSLLLLLLYSLSFKANNHENYELIERKLDSKNNVSKNYKMKIKNSIYEGYTNNNSPYKFFADNIEKDANDSYELSSVTGNCNFSKKPIDLSAKNAKIDEKTNLVLLKNDVRIMYEGLVLSGPEILLDLKNSYVESLNGVEVDFDNSNIKANKFHTIDKDEEVIFEGDVKTKINLKDEFHVE